MQMERTDNPKELPRLAFRAVFLNQPFVYKGQYQSKTIISAKKRLSGLRIGDWLYIEQNPYTDSRYADAARDGQMILWVIHTPTDTWCFRVENGIVKRLPGADKFARKARALSVG